MGYDESKIAEQRATMARDDGPGPATAGILAVVAERDALRARVVALEGECGRYSKHLAELTTERDAIRAASDEALAAASRERVRLEREADQLKAQLANAESSRADAVNEAADFQERAISAEARAADAERRVRELMRKREPLVVTSRPVTLDVPGVRVEVVVHGANPDRIAREVKALLERERITGTDSPSPFACDKCLALVREVGGGRWCAKYKPRPLAGESCAGFEAL